MAETKSPIDENALCKFMNKDYPLLLSGDAEYGVQTTSRFGQLHYLRFFDLLVADIDLPKKDDAKTQTPSHETLLKRIETRLEALGLLTGMLWVCCWTSGGYHLILLSGTASHHSNTAIQLFCKMQDLVDEWYFRMAMHAGFKVRVSPKRDGEVMWNKTENTLLGDAQPDGNALKLFQLIEAFKTNPDFASRPAQVFTLPLTTRPDGWFTSSFLDRVLRHDFAAEPLLRDIWTDRNALFESFDSATQERILVARMKKPQRLFRDTERWYLAQDVITCTYYVCFKHLLMIDIDTKEGLSFDQLREDFSTVQGTFAVHETCKGWHVFDVTKGRDKLHDRSRQVSVDFMRDHGCDRGYVVYAQARGWSVRLNRKRHEPEDQNIYTAHPMIGLNAEAEPSSVLTSEVELVLRFMSIMRAKNVPHSSMS